MMKLVRDAPKSFLLESVEGGAIGYFGANGDMDSCIALRTAIIKDATLYIQAGGGGEGVWVMADTVPAVGPVSMAEIAVAQRQVIEAANLLVEFNAVLSGDKKSGDG